MNDATDTPPAADQDESLRPPTPAELRRIRDTVRLVLLQARGAFFARVAMAEPLPSLETDIEPIVDAVIRPVCDLLGDAEPARRGLVGAFIAKATIMETLAQDVQNTRLFRAQLPPDEA